MTIKFRAMKESKPPPLADSSQPVQARRMFFLAMSAAVLLSLPSLEIGFFLDDYHQIALIEGLYDFERPALNLYSSFLDFPDVPWWTSESTRTGFWRPLSSALLRLDHALFGRNPLPWHLHSLLWLAALIGVVGLCFRGLPARLAGLALLLFALDESHSMPAGVLCNRHSLVTATVAFAGLWAYLRYREDGWSTGRWLAPLIFAVALAFGETTVPVMAYPLAYELCCRREAWSERLRAIAPIAALAVAYVVAYGYLELGPRDLEVYLNPLQDPKGFVVGMGRHLPPLLSGGLAAFPASLWLMGPEAQLALEIVGCLVLVWLLVWCWWHRARLFGPRADDPKGENDLLPMWLVGALGALPAVAPAFPSDRQLLVPAVGFSVIIATWILDTQKLLRRAERPAIKAVAGVALCLLLLLHLGLAPLFRIQMQRGTAELGRTTSSIVETLETMAVEAGELDPNSPSSNRVDGGEPISRFLVVHSPDFFTTIYPSIMWEHRHGPGTVSWNVISSTPVTQELTRTGDRTLETRALDGRYLRATLDRAFYLADAISVEGGVIEPPKSAVPLRIEVLETAPRDAQDPLDNGPAALPTRLRFTVSSSLDRGWHLVTWRDGELVGLDMPAIGESITVEPSPGLMGLI